MGNERGSGIAIYIFTVFLVLTIVALATANVFIKQAESVKQRGQVLLFHALSDAVHTAEIVPTYENGRMVNEMTIPSDTALHSFCTPDFDGVSVSKVFRVQEGGPNCIGQTLNPLPGNKDFPYGIKVTDFVVVNSITDPAYSRYQQVNGQRFAPPFIFAKVEIPRDFRVNGKDYSFTYKIAAVYRPAMLDATKGDFIIPDIN